MTKQSKTVRSQASQMQYRVRNWSEYNASLVKRGSLTVWLDADALRGWRAVPSAKRTRGGQLRFAPLAIETLLTLCAVFH